MSASSSPARRARESAIMSAKQKRFNSSPLAPHQRPPSVSTPSTSKATARICFRLSCVAPHPVIVLDRCAYAPKFSDHRQFPFVDALDAIPLGLFPQPDIAHKLIDTVWSERG